jgi:hypothetical protein
MLTKEPEKLGVVQIIPRESIFNYAHYYHILS